MTICRECGADLTGVPLQARGDAESLLDFLKGIPTKNDPRAKPGHPRYDKKDGFLECPTCGRKIPVSPKMAHNPSEYDVL